MLRGVGNCKIMPVDVGTSANTLGGSSKRMGKLLPTFEKADPR
jgi:hypothetical protein